MKLAITIVCPWLKVNAMAIFPFILVKQPHLKHDAQLIRHETIHLRQELELLIIPFYILYLFNYLINLWRYRDHNKAYLNIIFEREAYSCEADVNYLIKRPFWAWIKFINTTNNS
jgi:hypothetical protein